ncbi:T9SS type A sorting domain-containing protein [bacterium]|nr:T9SS type A sorting domain-containing protein [bacterium]
MFDRRQSGVTPCRSHHLRIMRHCAGALIALGLVAVSSSRATAAPSAEALSVADRLESMGAYFEAHPELKEQKGSGWNPYNRLKWFHEQRMLNGELPAPGARWRAWERKRELEIDLEHNRAFGSSWFSLGPNNLAGRMLAVDFDPNNASTVYAGAAGGGAFKSTDSGATWFPITDELPTLAVGGLAVSKTNSNIVVIGTGEATLNIDRIGGVGLLRSTDAGATWDTTSVSYGVVSGHGFHFVEAGPNGTFLAGATDGLYRSTDDGVNWDQVRVGDDYYDAKWKPGDPNRVYTVKGNGTLGNNCKVSTDDGATWTKAGTGQPLLGKTKLAVSADQPSWVYMFVGLTGTSGGIDGLYRTTDDGATWQLRTSTGLPSGQSWYNLICGADPNNADLVIVGAVGISRSLNGGASFSGIGGLHSDHHCIGWEPGNDSNLYVGGDGGMYRSVNDGASFSYRSTNLSTYQFYDICVNNGPDPYYVMGGTQDQGTDKWSGTTSWAEGLGADGMVCNINPLNGTTVYAEIQNGSHRKNTNSGSGSWSTINNGIPGSNSQWVVPVAEDQSAGNHLYTSHSGSGLYRTTNGGSLWTNVAPHTATWIDISPVDGNIIWSVGSPKVSTDDGNSWTNAASYGFTVGGETKVLCHPTDANTALVTFSSYGALAHVAMTTDLGGSWTDVTGDFPSQPVNAIAINPSHTEQWFIGTDVGVWTSSNGGVNWLPYETGFPNAVVVDLEIKDSLQKLVAGTHGRGAWEIDITQPSTSVDIATSRENVHLMFDRPWPTPISDRVLLRYAAKHDGEVSLRIYDVQGRLVSDVASLSSGDGVIRTTPWYPADVRSGVYFAVLQAGEMQKTQKLIVRK